MKQGTDNSPNRVKKFKYVSCIKINGISILPPLITSEKRKELRRYRREAIKVEKRLQRERELKDYISQLYRSCSREFENDGLNTTIESIVEQVEATNFNENNKSTIGISVDALDEISASNLRTANSKYPAEEVVIAVVDTDEEARSKTPKLIRSNSYTVESPSPALLEYLRTKEGPSYCWDVKKNASPKESSISSEIKDEFDMTSEVIQDRFGASCNNSVAISESTIIQQPQNVCNDLQVSSIDDETPRGPSDTHKKHNCALDTNISTLNVSDDCYDTSRTDTELRNLSDCESHIPLSDNIHEFMANNIADRECLIEANISESDKSELTELCNNSDLNSILKKIPVEYSRRILDILERHQFTNYIADRFEDIHLEPEKYSTPHETGLCETIYYSVNDDNDSTIQEQEEQRVQRIKQEKVKQKEQEKLARVRAATILCAATKGFLVRRLIKTEKVQNLIQTIRDALVCAMQLHKDTLDYIEEADVELHRRLIQQVSAGCFAFHDVFFATSTLDKLSIIAVDRQKKREKLRRLSSANSAASNRSSSRSTLSSSRNSRTPNRKSRNLAILHS